MSERSESEAEREQAACVLQARLRAKLHRRARRDEELAEPSNFRVRQQHKFGGRGFFSGDAEVSQPPVQLTASELELESRGGITSARLERVVSFWRKLLRYGVVLPQAMVLVIIPVVAVLPHHQSTDGRIRYYQTMNFYWVLGYFIGVFLSTQLMAVFLECVLASTVHLRHKGPYVPRIFGDSAVSQEAMDAALAQLGRFSILERILGIEFRILMIEIFIIWLVANILDRQLEVSLRPTAAVWVQTFSILAFLIFEAGAMPHVFKAIKIGIVRREKANTVHYVNQRFHQFLLPALVLQTYLLFYGFYVLTARAPPVLAVLLRFDLDTGARDLLCGKLGQDNCTMILDTAIASDLGLMTTPYRPDVVSCEFDPVLVYPNRYTACLMAQLGDDLYVRGFMGVAASLTAIITVICVELLQQIPLAVKGPLALQHMLCPNTETGMSWRVKIITLLIWMEAVASLLYVLFLSVPDIGRTLYSEFWIFILVFSLPKVTAICCLLAEFISRRFDGSADMFTTLSDGRGVSVRQELQRLIEGYVAQHPESVGVGVETGENRFVSEAQMLITGKPKDAALGINFYMQVDLYTFAMPSYANGCSAILAEFERSGTSEDKECLNYCLLERAGSSDKTFANGDLRRDCDAAGELLPERRNAEGLGMTLDDFCNDPAARIAELRRPHVLALRLYSTAVFRALNDPFRVNDDERSAHNFPITVNFIKEAISQLRAVEADTESASGSIDLWRGLKNVTVADAFLHQGGTELAPMSTTSNLAVAVQYSLSPSSLILKLKTNSFMERGANLSWVSAFPAEAEVLFPPLTFLHPTGRTLTLEQVGFKVTVVEVEPKH